MNITNAQLNGMTETELLNLNQRVVDCIRSKRAQKARSFKLGEAVEFTARSGRVLTGVVTRRNKKSVSVKVYDGICYNDWRVTPNLLRPASV